MDIIIQLKKLNKFKELKDPRFREGRLKELFTDIVFYLSILFFIIGFNFTDSPPPSGWYQQFMPNLGGRNISDIFFLDSLTGWAVTNATNQANDTTYVLKTTNAGDNWNIYYKRLQTGGGFPGLYRIHFLNQNTGFICGVTGIDKSNNGGTSWTSLNAPFNNYMDMSVLSEDTIWITSSNSLTGGVYRTTNGGASWDRQLSIGSDNPDHIYMYNGQIGFISKLQVYLRKTTNGGTNWTIDTTGSDSGFLDMYFADSMTGWKSSAFGIRKTTNGGINWFIQSVPQGGIIQGNGISSFSNINKDTIWANGGYVLYPNNQVRGILNRTTNGGLNWLFQVPDTSIHIGGYGFCDFVNKLNGWAYVGIHTVTGGDTTFYTGIINKSNTIPKDFILKQNYPNPFNPRTVIPYSIKSSAHVKLIAYDILGKEVQAMVDDYQQPGEYEVDFMGKFSSTGVYFYRLSVDDKVIDTKKMILIK